MNIGPIMRRPAHAQIPDCCAPAPASRKEFRLGRRLRCRRMRALQLLAAVLIDHPAADGSLR